MRLDLLANLPYSRHHQWLYPRAAADTRARVSAFYTNLWAHANAVSPNAFNEIKNIIPSLTNGTRTNPTRRQVLTMIDRVRQGQYNPNDAQEVAVAVLLATRLQRWTLLAGHVQSVVPHTFRLYRYVHGIQFCVNVARQFDAAYGNPRQLGMIHDPITPWSMLEKGAVMIKGTASRPMGVLYVADISFDQTIADIFVDDSHFQSVYCRQAEVLVAAPVNTLVALPQHVQVYLGGRVYTSDEWASLGQALRQMGHTI